MQNNLIRVLRKLPSSLGESPPHFALGIKNNENSPIENLCGCIIYVWLKNKSGAWFFADTATYTCVLGHLWNGYKWVPYSLIKEDIIQYY